MVVSCLHFTLLHQHFFFDFVDFLLFFNFELINDSAVFFSKLLDVEHQLLLRLLPLLQLLTLAAVLVVQVLNLRLALSNGLERLLELLRKILLDGFVVASFEFESKMITGLECVGLDNLENRFVTSTYFQNANKCG
jgi:hypothetical protein